MEKVFEIYIRTTPERLWAAITGAEARSVYQFGNVVTSDWTPGSRYEMRNPKAPDLLGEGENLQVDPPCRLVQSFRALWGEDVKSEGTSRVTWEIEPVGDIVRLTLTHEIDCEPSKLIDGVSAGCWSRGPARCPAHHAAQFAASRFANCLRQTFEW